MWDRQSRVEGGREEGAARFSRFGNAGDWTAGAQSRRDARAGGVGHRLLFPEQCPSPGHDGRGCWGQTQPWHSSPEPRVGPSHRLGHRDSGLSTCLRVRTVEGFPFMNLWRIFNSGQKGETCP